MAERMSAKPAEILGLANKGHLGIGADADLTVYVPDRNYEAMFSVPRWVLKGGQIVVDDYEIRDAIKGRTLSQAPRYDTSRNGQIESWFDDHYSLKAKHYGIQADEFDRIRVIV